MVGRRADFVVIAAVIVTVPVQSVIVVGIVRVLLSAL
jgi:hypothetical protein